MNTEHETQTLVGVLRVVVDVCAAFQPKLAEFLERAGPGPALAAVEERARPVATALGKRAAEVLPTALQFARVVLEGPVFADPVLPPSRHRP
ncbi:MAG: hypothetical protein HYV09_33565 [Deltaproteobacteria bacterium]|nr:hypothetical protein [Deltaproteobacteria bacterium]